MSASEYDGDQRIVGMAKARVMIDALRTELEAVKAERDEAVALLRDVWERTNLQTLEKVGAYLAKRQP